MGLVYLGISLANSLQHPLAARLSFADSETLSQVKLSHDEYPLLLDTLKAFPFVEEVTLVTTCNRFEIVSFLKNGYDKEPYISQLQEAIRSINKSKINLNVLYGNDAKLQILRTFCGFNSGLVGEDEICMQFEISFKQTFHMSYLGKQGMSLLHEAIVLRKILDKAVFNDKVSYCEIGLKESIKRFPNNDFKNIIVAGSGSTANQACLALIRLGYQAENITLLHRISSNSGQITAIKASSELQNINYIRCKDGYHANKAKEAFANADLIVFGIDSRLPSLHLSKHYKQAIIDFSFKPSCSFDTNADQSRYISSAQLDSFVREFSDIRIANPSFKFKLERAEEILSARIESLAQEQVFSEQLLPTLG